MKGFMERNEELIKTTMVALKLNYREQTEDQRTILEKHRSVDIPKVKKGKRKKEKGKRKVGLFGLELHQERHHKMGKYGKHHDKKMKGEKGEKIKGRKPGKVVAQFILWDGTFTNSSS